MAHTNQNQAQIIALIEQLKGDIAINFTRICELLLQLNDYYLHKNEMFKWYKEVASGKLTSEAVLALSRRGDCLKHIIGRPRDVQIAIAQDGEFTWCSVSKGEIVDRRTPCSKMLNADFKRMFPIGAPIRSVSEQRAILVQELAAKPVTHIRRQPIARVNVADQTFSLGAQTVPINIIIAALREAKVDGFVTD